MVINNVKVVQRNKTIEVGHIVINNGQITKVCEVIYKGKEECIDCNGLIAMPGFIDVHIHGSMCIDFIDANKDDYK